MKHQIQQLVSLALAMAQDLGDTAAALPVLKQAQAAAQAEREAAAARELVVNEISALTPAATEALAKEDLPKGLGALTWRTMPCMHESRNVDSRTTSGAILKIGASGSLLTATMDFEFFMPAKC